MRRIKGSQGKSEELFINSADDVGSHELNPDAARNYKQISLPMNEYEYQMLEKAAKKEGRSQKNLIRIALIEKAKSILN